jgi:hypothetical protein
MDTHKEITATLATSSARKDERKLQAMIHARVVKTSSTAEFDAVCKEFKRLVKEIKLLAALVGQDYSNFRGGYLEIAMMQNPFDTTKHPDQLDQWIAFESLIRRLLAIDQECKYQGYKLGYSGNEWFKKCWKK